MVERPSLAHGITRFLRIKHGTPSGATLAELDKKFRLFMIRVTAPPCMQGYRILARALSANNLQP